MKQCLDGEPSLRAASALLLGKLQGAVRKRAGVASECRHIDRLRPAVRRVMIDLAGTHPRPNPPPALRDGRTFPGSRGVVWRLAFTVSPSFSNARTIHCSST